MKSHHPEDVKTWGLENLFLEGVQHVIFMGQIFQKHLIWLQVATNAVFFLLFDLEYPEAKEFYTNAIKICPNDFTKEKSIFYANRAACLVKMVWSLLLSSDGIYNVDFLIFFLCYCRVATCTTKYFCQSHFFELLHFSSEVIST